jgi:hypothetical protein
VSLLNKQTSSPGPFSFGGRRGVFVIPSPSKERVRVRSYCVLSRNICFFLEKSHELKVFSVCGEIV